MRELDKPGCLAHRSHRTAANRRLAHGTLRLVQSAHSQLALAYRLLPPGHIGRSHMLTTSSKAGLVVSMAMAAMMLSTGVARAEGVVQNASKDVAKGAIKGVQQELNSPSMVNSAKQVTKGMVDGMAD